MEESHRTLENWPEEIGLSELEAILKRRGFNPHDPLSNPGDKPQTEVQFKHDGGTITAGVKLTTSPSTASRKRKRDRPATPYAWVRASPRLLQAAEALLREVSEERRYEAEDEVSSDWEVIVIPPLPTIRE